MTIIPKILEVSKDDLQSFPNHLVLDGSEVDIQILPEELQNWNQLQHIKKRDIASFTVGAMKNEYCQLIASNSVINPLNTGLGLPQFAMIPIDLTIPINPNEQFLSIDNPAHPVFIGLLLNTYTEERTLKSVRIIPRISIDSVKPTLNSDGQLINQVPIPQLYQIYGTHDNIDATTHKDSAKLNWEAITNPTRMSSSDWTFATPTDLIFNKKNYDQLKYKGFKFVVHEWNYDNASKIDRFPGFYRIEFNFLEDSEKWILPHIPVTEGHVAIINLDDLLSETEEIQAIEPESIPTLDETIREFQNIEIDSELSEKFAEALEISRDDKLITFDPPTKTNSAMKELIQKVEQLQIEVGALTTTLSTQKEEFTRTITKLTKEKKTTKSAKTEVPDEIIKQIEELVAASISDIEQVSKRNVSEINSVATKQVSRLVEINEENTENLDTDFVTKEQCADKIAELLSVIDEKCSSLNSVGLPKDFIKSENYNKFMTHVFLTNDDYQNWLEEHQSKLNVITQQIVDLYELKNDLSNEESTKFITEATQLLEEQKKLIEESKLQMGSTLNNVIDTAIEAANVNLKTMTDQAICDIKLHQFEANTTTPETVQENILNPEYVSLKIFEDIENTIQKLQLELDELTDDTSIINVESTYQLKLDDQSGTIKHWCIFGERDGTASCIVSLPSKPEDSQVITIQNFRNDNGHVDIESIYPLAIVYENKQLADRKSLGLTAKMEKLNVIFYNGRWHGELTDGLINQE